MDEKTKLAWLRLARCSGIGPILFFQLLEKFGCAEAAIEALKSEKLKKQLNLADIPSVQAVETEYGQIVDHDATLLLASDERYPFYLRNIADPPPILIVLGQVSLLSAPSVAIVGARNASANGKSFARQMASDLAQADITVVSGLARGIDSAAHKGALAHRGSTIAAIATGADIAYPPENAALMSRIIDEGAVVTERPFGAGPRSNFFPKRNRIIAGLTVGTIVVEAAVPSGTLITAKFAADSGREVMAVPGTPSDSRHKGTNRLLRDGAHMIESAEDVLHIVEPLIQHHRSVPPKRQEIHARPEPASRPHVLPRPLETVPPIPSDVSTELLNLMSSEPVPVDELIRQCHASPSDIQDCLLDLEMNGQISRHSGNRVSLTLN